jgi:hypothetical protein
MANFTLSSGDYIRPRSAPWGATEIRTVAESTGQSFRYGALIENDLDASTAAGRAALATVSGSTVTSTTIIGIAAAPASSVVTTKIPYYPANPNTQFWGRTIRGVLDSSCVFKAYGLAYDSTLQIFLVDLGNAASTSERVIVTELIDAVGDSGGAVSFVFGHYNSTLMCFHGQGRS